MIHFLFQSLTRDISYSMENLAIDSLLEWKLIEQSFLTTHSIIFFLNGWENLYYVLGIDKVNASWFSDEQIHACTENWKVQGGMVWWTENRAAFNKSTHQPHVIFPGAIVQW